MDALGQLAGGKVRFAHELHSLATGIGRITLSRMLNHSGNVRSDTLDRLCTYFGCRIEDLVEHVLAP